MTRTKPPQFALPALSIPGWNKLAFPLRIKLLSALIVVFLVVTLAAGYLESRQTQEANRYATLSAKLLVLTQKLAKEAAAVQVGETLAFAGLEASRADFAAILEILDKGNDSLPATTGKPREHLAGLMALWQQQSGQIDEILALRQSQQSLTSAATQLEGLAPEIGAWLQTPAGQPFREEAPMLLGQLSAALVSAQAGMPEQVAELAKRLEAELTKWPADADGLRQKVEQAVQPLAALAGQADKLAQAKASARSLIKQSDGLYAVTQRLVSSYEEVASNTTSGLVQSFAAGLMLLALLLLSKTYMDESRRREEETARINAANQAAILRLMNELAELADGNLTVKATVTEDITGAIADAVNFTADELRKLVVRVSAASKQVAHATEETGQVAKELLIAAKAQAEQIRQAGEAVALMRQSVQEVDASASQSAGVAQRTLTVTGQGAQAVRNTISGMDGIRGQIQETAKRIKRLGESSQEIGEIVDLINDITEQTNVLALNAAIQAAAAGEAGRGFTVVAEEVQRLAERSAAATKQISALVRTIQGDTQDAVAAMEQSTQGVVEGAKLADAAGQSLREIESASHELADLVSSISVSTQVQTDMVGEVANMMNDILKVTEQNTYSTQRTNSSLAQLDKLARELNDSVSGFKL